MDLNQYQIVLVNLDPTTGSEIKNAALGHNFIPLDETVRWTASKLHEQKV
ncbi:MAG: hypothetical protein R6U58_05925 [Bacteroidales bacterium]